jgi:hypothetical protein
VTVSASQPSAALVTGSVGTIVLISLLRLDVPIVKAEVTNSDNQATESLIVVSVEEILQYRDYQRINKEKDLSRTKEKNIPIRTSPGPRMNKKAMARGSRRGWDRIPMAWASKTPPCIATPWPRIVRNEKQSFAQTRTSYRNEYNGWMGPNSAAEWNLSTDRQPYFLQARF